MESLETYLREKNVEELLSNLVFEISLHRPLDVKRFIIDYLDRHGDLFPNSKNVESSCGCQHSSCSNKHHQTPNQRHEQGPVVHSPEFRTPPNQHQTNRQISFESPQPNQQTPNKKYFGNSPEPETPQEPPRDPHANLGTFRMGNNPGGMTDSPLSDDEEEYSNDNRPTEKVSYMNDSGSREMNLASYQMTSTGHEKSKQEFDEEEGLSDVSHIDNMKSRAMLRRYSLAVAPGRRQSIVGESISLESLKDYKPPTYPKTPDDMTFLQAALAENVLFRTMEPEELMNIFRAMKKIEFKGGDVLIKQGDDGDFFYVLASGTCNIFIECSGYDGYGKLVKVCKKFDCFGELALMYNQKRAATVVASSKDVSTFAIDRCNFRKLVMGQSADRRKRYVEFLEAVPILYPLTQYERLKIADALEPFNFFERDEILGQGDVGNRFFIIAFGEVEVIKFVDAENEDHPLSDEVLAQLNNMRKAGSLEYGPPNLGMGGDGQDQDHGQDSFHPQKKYIEDEMSMSSGEEMEGEMDEDEEGGAGQGERRRVLNPPEGCTSDVIEIMCGVLGEKSYFGELALLHDCKRQASCIAKTALVKCVGLSRNRFDRLLGPCIEIMKRNEENYQLYVSPDNEETN